MRPTRSKRERPPSDDPGRPPKGPASVSRAVPIEIIVRIVDERTEKEVGLIDPDRPAP